MAHTATTLPNSAQFVHIIILHCQQFAEYDGLEIQNKVQVGEQIYKLRERTKTDKNCYSKSIF